MPGVATIGFARRIDFAPTTNAFWILPAAGFVAGFIDSIAGGGGMISLPALLEEIIRFSKSPRGPRFFSG